MSNRIGRRQQELLLDYMERHPMLARTTVNMGKGSNKTIKQKWDELAVILNAAGDGLVRTGQQWKRYWINLKSRVKTRAGNERQEREATGGGPNTECELIEYEKRVLSIVGHEAVYGDESLIRPSFVTRSPQGTSSCPPVLPLTPNTPPPAPPLLPIPRVLSAPQYSNFVIMPSTSTSTLEPVAASEPVAAPPASPVQAPPPEPDLAQIEQRQQRRTDRPPRQNNRREPYAEPPQWYEDLERTRRQEERRNTELIINAIDRLTAVLQAFLDKDSHQSFLQ